MFIYVCLSIIGFFTCLGLSIYGVFFIGGIFYNNFIKMKGWISEHYNKWLHDLAKKLNPSFIFTQIDNSLFLSKTSWYNVCVGVLSHFSSKHYFPKKNTEFIDSLEYYEIDDDIYKKIPKWYQPNVHIGEKWYMIYRNVKTECNKSFNSESWLSFDEDEYIPIKQVINIYNETIVIDIDRVLYSHTFKMVFQPHLYKFGFKNGQKQTPKKTNYFKLVSIPILKWFVVIILAAIVNNVYDFVKLYIKYLCS